MEFLISDFFTTKNTDMFSMLKRDFMFGWLHISNAKPFFDLMSIEELKLFTKNVLSRPVTDICSSTGHPGSIVFSWYVQIFNYLYKRSPEVAECAAVSIYYNGDLNSVLMHEEIDFTNVKDEVYHLIKNLESAGPNARSLLGLWTHNAVQYKYKWLFYYLSSVSEANMNVIDGGGAVLTWHTVRCLSSEYHDMNDFFKKRVVDFLKRWLGSLVIEKNDLTTDLALSIFYALSVLPKYTENEKKIIDLILHSDLLEFNKTFELYMMVLGQATEDEKKHGVPVYILLFIKEIY